MLMVLLGAGIALLLAGLGALGFGIPYKEFGFGNTLIVAGAVTACSGFLMIGLWAVARELQQISQRLGSGASASTQPAFPAESSLAPALVPPPRAAGARVSGDPGAAPPWVEGRPDASSPSSSVTTSRCKSGSCAAYRYSFPAVRLATPRDESASQFKERAKPVPPRVTPLTGCHPQAWWRKADPPLYDVWEPLYHGHEEVVTEC